MSGHTPERYDLIIVGGGATGAGVALDAALRGLRVLLLERNDFAEGTSSRSTKLVHGGVRYLEAAVKHLDKEQYALVREGLSERQIFLHNAPHLAHPLQLLTPLYRWSQVPYVYAGLVLYDLLSGRASLGRSRLLGPSTARKRSPGIRAEGLKAAVSYWDGAFRDSRMVVALLQSAVERGAVVRNHTEVTQLRKEEGRIVGVRARSRLDGTERSYDARLVVNATGPYADTLHRMDDPGLAPLMIPSRGVHIILPKRFLPGTEGILIPRTRDGRVLFVLPYLDYCLAGTTDEEGPLEEDPRPREEEIDYLLEHLNGTFDLRVERSAILAAFAGLRPLVRKPGAHSTAELVREYITELSPGGMLTITGGKWTSYRAMAEAAVDKALDALGEALRPCRTRDYPVVGSREARAKTLDRLHGAGLAEEEARHLYAHYGDRSLAILDLAKRENLSGRLHPGHPLLRAELLYTLREEWVRKPLDFLVRRASLGLLDPRAARECLPAVLEMMREECRWDEATLQARRQEARMRLGF